jgi:hypothetical protein
MKKLLTIILICSMVNLSAYTMLSTEEATAFIASAPEEVVSIVQYYDYMEHTVPEIDLGTVEYLLVGDNLLVNYNGITINHGLFSYQLDVQPEIVYNFIQEDTNDLEYIVIFGIGIILGGMIGYSLYVF